MNIVNIDRLVKTHKDKGILDIENFTVDQNDFQILFGENDSGLTSLLHILIGYDVRYSGNVEVLGCKPGRKSESDRKRVRYVPDDIIMEEIMIAEEYLKIACKATSEYDIKLQSSLCETFEIDIKDKLMNMTYNNNKLVQIIAAVCARPDLLMLDEPVNFLNINSYKKVLKILDKLNNDGMCIVLTVENYEDARDCGNRYAYFRKGKVVQSGKIIVPDYRNKIISMQGADKEYMENHMDKEIYSEGQRSVYLYKQEISRLPSILKDSGARDFTVESMKLEEEINSDYSRWE